MNNKNLLNSIYIWKEKKKFFFFSTLFFLCETFVLGCAKKALVYMLKN